MWKPILLWLCLSGYCLAGPLSPKRNMPIIQRQEEEMEKETTAVAKENDASKPEAANTVAAPPNMLMISTLTLPSNATSIRADITDGFSCANKPYGYYADVDNDCQIFHVCLPVTYADGRENTFRWSFICPEETIFSQDSFTCMRREDMTIDCEDSSKYYELNRNFGMTDEDDNKHMQNTGEMNSEMHLGNEDQEPAMTIQVEQEKQPQQATQQQVLSDEKPEKAEKPNSHPSKPNQLMPQKEKPMKVQKPNRRKPAITITNNSNKRKPAAPVRKVTQPVTAQPVIATTLETLPEEEDTKPPRYTKRPSTLAANLKEKFQPIKQPEATPVRVDLYNQKRKRPSIFNKKDSTTLRPAEEVVPITEQLTVHEPTLPLVTELKKESEPETQKIEPVFDKNTANLPDLIAPQASETNSVVVKPELSSPSTDAKNIENKKISKPQPTEPETVALPEITKIEETPVIAPLEAIEEIPAVITEVEETSSNQQDSAAASQSDIQEIASEAESPKTHTENISTETHANSPAIFQQNSEENFAPASGLSIEEMESQKPNNAPEVVPATLDMEQQDPMIEQIFSGTDAEANKQTMGGFKPVDPAMAAEAEALIANFLNTLMKTEKTNSDQEMPTNEMVKPESTDLNQDEGLSNEQANQETKPEATEAESSLKTLSPTETHVLSNQQTIPIAETIQPFPSMMMMMNNHPGEIFQIPVQVIQSPIEEITKTQSTPNEVPTSVIGPLSSPNSPRPISIDDIVELVKDKLDHVPVTEKEQATKNEESNDAKQTAKNDSIAPELTEQLIVPIYHRVSSEPNENMIKAHIKDENVAAHEDLSAVSDNTPSTPETEIKANPKAPTNTETQLNTDRTQRARSIKTVPKMDPRKRRFLFKSDAS